MSAVKSAYKTTFHNTIVRMLDYIRDNVPDLKKQMISYKGLYRYVSGSDEPLIMFNKYAKPHKTDIESKNDNFVKDLNIAEIVGETDDDVALEEGMFLRDMWNSDKLTDEIKDNLWKFLIVLNKVSDKYVN